MARKKKIDLDRLGLELLALTIDGAKQRYTDAKAEGYPVDAATISASVSLLKLVEAAKAARAGEDTAELEALRQQFQAKAKATAPDSHLPDDAALRAMYGVSNPTH